MECHQSGSWGGVAVGVRRAHLVGSIPAVTAAKAMRLAVERLGPELDYVPDGETGGRRNWVISMIEALPRSPPRTTRRTSARPSTGRWPG